MENNWETEDFLYGIKVLINKKPIGLNILKALEELSELSTKLLQYLNKSETINKDDIAEEITDCEMHFHVLKHLFPISGDIRKTKINKFLSSKDYLHYKQLFEDGNSITKG